MIKCEYKLRNSPCGPDICCADCPEENVCLYACHTDPAQCPHVVVENNENSGLQNPEEAKMRNSVSSELRRAGKTAETSNEKESRKFWIRPVGIAVLLVGLLSMVAVSILYPLVQRYGLTRDAYDIPAFISPYHAVEQADGSIEYEQLETTLLISYEDEFHMSVQYECSCSTEDDPHYIVVIWCGDYVYYTSDISQPALVSGSSGTSTEQFRFDGTIYVADATETETVLTSFTIDAEQWAELLYGADPAANGWFDLQSETGKVL